MQKWDSPGQVAEAGQPGKAKGCPQPFNILFLDYREGPLALTV